MQHLPSLSLKSIQQKTGQSPSSIPQNPDYGTGPTAGDPYILCVDVCCWRFTSFSKFLLVNFTLSWYLPHSEAFLYLGIRSELLFPALH